MSGPCGRNAVRTTRPFYTALPFRCLCSISPRMSTACRCIGRGRDRARGGGGGRAGETLPLSCAPTAFVTKTLPLRHSQPKKALVALLEANGGVAQPPAAEPAPEPYAAVTGTSVTATDGAGCASAIATDGAGSEEQSADASAGSAAAAEGDAAGEKAPGRKCVAVLPFCCRPLSR